MKIIDLGRP